MMARRSVAFAMCAVVGLGMVSTTGPLAGATSKTTTTQSARTHKSTTTTTQRAKTQKKKPKKKLPSPHIGQVAKDGDFAFRITSVQCGLTTIGSSPLTETAPTGSQWCLTNMTVKNIKGAAQEYFPSNQYAFDGKGRKLSADTGALIYLPGSGPLVATINPGVSISAVVPFQLPASSKIQKFVLHDSAFSNGVTVWNVSGK